MSLSATSAPPPYLSAYLALAVDGVNDRILIREAMEELHRLASSLTPTQFEALMPMAMCLFAHCLGVTRVDWISSPSVRYLLSGTRCQMFEWLDDVFADEPELAGG